YREYIHHSHQYHRPELVTGNGWREDLANVVNSNAPNAGGARFSPTPRTEVTRRTISGGGQGPIRAGDAYDDETGESGDPGAKSLFA
ncbi:hypothetical protein, partial [Alkalilimnicola ehrlichii]